MNNLINILSYIWLGFVLGWACTIFGFGVSGISAFRLFRERLKADPEWAWTWYCNISMLLHNAGVEIHEANRKAESFMYNTFMIDITRNSKWECKYFEKEN
jgi:hypothetical protein